MKRVVLFILALLLTACSGPTTTAPPPATQVIIPETTKVSDPATRTALTAYDRTSGVMRFSQNTPTLASLKPGDVLVSGPSNAAPNGYLRQVTAVGSEGAETVLETTQAKLTDAVSQGVLDAKVDLTPDKVQRTETFLPGVTFTANAPGIKAQDQVGVGQNYAQYRHLQPRLRAAGWPQCQRPDHGGRLSELQRGAGRIHRGQRAEL